MAVASTGAQLLHASSVFLHMRNRMSRVELVFEVCFEHLDGLCQKARRMTSQRVVVGDWLLEGGQVQARKKDLDFSKSFS